MRNSAWETPSAATCLSRGEMLKVYKLTHDGKGDMAYHAGKAGGIKFNVRRKNK